MKNSNAFRKVIMLAAVIIITALPAFCSPTVPIKQTAIKFLVAMGGVAASSLLIYFGLTLYNKLFVNKDGRTFSKDDTLATPDNTDDAVAFFIKKNKLR